MLLCSLVFAKRFEFLWGHVRVAGRIHHQCLLPVREGKKHHKYYFQLVTVLVHMLRIAGSTHMIATTSNASDLFARKHRLVTLIVARALQNITSVLIMAVSEAASLSANTFLFGAAILHSL